MDPILLLATGLLSQEKRLQAIEQRLNIQSTNSAQPTSELARARVQQTLEERKMLPMGTRVTYLEEDVEENRVHTDFQLQAVYDLARDAQRRETEDITMIQEELSDNVAQLEREINSTFRRVESDIDALKVRVNDNTGGINANLHRYFRLTDGLYRTIEYVRHVEYTLEDRIYILEEQMKEVMKYLERKEEHGTTGTTRPTEQEQSTTSPTEVEQGNEFPTEPSVGDVGNTEGRKAAKVMSDAEKALQEWMNSEKPVTKTPTKQEENAEVQSAAGKNQRVSLMELLRELNNYNM